MKTVVALFKRYEDADVAIQELHHRGFQNRDISVLAREHVVRDSLMTSPVDPAGRTVAEGAVGGATLGGLGGLLIGLGVLTVPGVGPAFAAGTLAATLSATAGGASLGAVGGSLLGALAGWDVPAEDAAVYAEGVKRGGILVAVHAHNEGVPQVMDVFQDAQALDIKTLRDQLHRSGWTRSDETSTVDEIYPRL